MRRGSILKLKDLIRIDTEAGKVLMSNYVTKVKCLKCGYVISMSVSLDNTAQYKVKVDGNILKFQCGNCGCGIEISHELVTWENR